MLEHDARDVLASIRRGRDLHADLAAEIARSRHLRARSLALALHGRRRIGGGSDADPVDVVAAIRARIRSGQLPGDPPSRMWAGLSCSGASLCDGCARLLGAGDVEYEISVTGHRTLRFHHTCFGVWYREVSV